MSDENAVEFTSLEVKGPAREAFKTPEHCTVPGCKSTKGNASYNWVCTSTNPGHPGAPPLS
jgi:hypothetical protein